MGLSLSSKQYLAIESDTIRKFAIKKEDGVLVAPALGADGQIAIGGAGAAAGGDVGGDGSGVEGLPDMPPGLIRNSSLADSSVDPNEFSDMQSLYSLLKREEATTATTTTTTTGGLEFGGSGVDISTGDADVLSSEVSGDAPLQSQAPISMNTDDDDVDLKPYKNDLAYMQDQIELSNCLSKIAGNLEKLEQLGKKERFDLYGWCV